MSDIHCCEGILSLALWQCKDVQVGRERRLRRREWVEDAALSRRSIRDVHWRRRNEEGNAECAEDRAAACVDLEVWAAASIATYMRTVAFSLGKALIPAHRSVPSPYGHGFEHHAERNPVHQELAQRSET